MKRLIKLGMLSVAMLVLMCGAAGAQEFNAQGSAIVPNISTWYKSPTNAAYGYIVISNITPSTVTCQISVLDHEGEDVSSRGTISTGDNLGNWSRIAVGTNTFEIPPYGSRMFSIDNTKQPRSIFGHAVIKWMSTDSKLSKALVGGYRFHGIGNGLCYDGTTLINSGNPF